MNSKRKSLRAVFSALAVAGGIGLISAAGVQAAVKPVNIDTCYQCHGNIKEFHLSGKHAGINCGYCHSETDQHLRGPMNKPVTSVDQRTCGQCHAEQFNSMLQVNWEREPKHEKANPTGRTSRYDSLMKPHGFTREHAEPRSHVFMLVDHLLVDRAYGGRFQLKSWELIGDGAAAQRGAWEVLYDVEPETNNQKPFMQMTATAANPVCMFCKSQDNILNWAYMGDPHPKAKWDRTSNVVDFARSLNHALNCFTCHDPHSTQPRITRDAQIQAIVDRGEGTYPHDPEKSQRITVEKVEFRGGYRAIGLLSQPDSTMMCAQCHVEYNCNPGIDAETGKPVTMADQRTNLMQWSNVFDYNRRMYEEFKFIDFRNAVTGADQMKLQHPETETFWDSKHERAGVECKDCHMPRLVSKAGVEYTSHFQTSPRYNLQATCLKCHSEWNEERALYTIGAIKAYTRGKINKAEFWLNELIDTFVRAQDLGVPEQVLAEARKHHTEANTHWEWWVAENSDGFHNPQQARKSLTHSMTESQKGIAILNKGIEERRQTIAKMR
ncbi:ammonia-forming cytochrome c nitrite reductase subunit c552 [Desulfurivibrio sp. D14AmB]|uniref:ammonia-forming cytochrome c nitrite reductase subunit c552 n=1 Tax=Desulfurivibrio sp. D14AmB TaxID=3374370 RepID=UPI00376F2A2B